MSELPPSADNPYTSPVAPTKDAMGSAMISGKTVEMLRQTRPWVIFMSVLLFIGSGFAILGGACVGLTGIFATAGAGAMAGGLPALLSIVYLLMGLFYFVPAYYLLRYGTQIGHFMYDRQQHQLDAALEAQKSFWKFVGIATAVVLAIYALVLIGALIFGGITGAAGR